MMYNRIMDYIWSWSAIAAFLGLFISVIGQISTCIQRKKDLKRQEKQRQEDLKTLEKQRQEDLKVLEKQMLFNRSSIPLNLEVQLNQISNPYAVEELKMHSLYNASGELILEDKMDFLKFFVNGGWLSKIYIIDSCFKDKDNPYIDMNKYYNNTQEFGELLPERVHEADVLWIEESGIRIRVFCSTAINFYPEIDPYAFYQFYLVQGEDKRCQLFMYGREDKGGVLLPFLFDRRGIATTINTVNPVFKDEYRKLEKYLKEQGYNIF